MLEFQSRTQGFAEAERLARPLEMNVVVSFSGTVRSSPAPAVLLQGFTYGFSRSVGDHPIGQVNVELEIPRGGINGREVTVRAVLGVRDWRNADYFWRFGGSISFVVVAEVG